MHAIKLLSKRRRLYRKRSERPNSIRVSRTLTRAFNEYCRPRIGRAASIHIRYISGGVATAHWCTEKHSLPAGHPNKRACPLKGFLWCAKHGQMGWMLVCVWRVCDSTISAHSDTDVVKPNAWTFMRENVLTGEGHSCVQDTSGRARPSVFSDLAKDHFATSYTKVTVHHIRDTRWPDGVLKIAKRILTGWLFERCGRFVRWFGFPDSTCGWCGANTKEAVGCGLSDFIVCREFRFVEFNDWATKKIT